MHNLSSDSLWNIVPYAIAYILAVKLLYILEIISTCLKDGIRLDFQSAQSAKAILLFWQIKEAFTFCSFFLDH